ncbi:helix-turn-helix domain-containing protein [Fimbriimonas ginsengisoli]|uniref:Transcriptional regulator, AraC family n=1 Tax=Fimbriimonas ginsengisoli Gsoil 348 TaxID=661478 RepID=A0A068NLW3_FIMGI|nr:helix-turn-helix domain-containing protein [Fimbriimonas ginsengisoli]AIE84461.1 Transcriptional regulator, AraC family [Fimbriimonas ginsengisoli Gsoil 348]
MDTLSRTEAEYIEAISKVVRFVQLALDEPLTPRQLAGVAGFSPHHFHRIFRAVVGESVMDFVRRLRLERAAYRLKTSQDSVASIAFEGGYGSQEAFARVFQVYFGQAPRDYRQSHLAHRIPSVSTLHYEPEGVGQILGVADSDMLTHEGLCAAHRQWPDRFESHCEGLMAILTGFSLFVFPPPPQEIIMTEAHSDIDREIEALHKEVEIAKQRLTEARRRRPKEPVIDYVLRNTDGSEVRLSELFGDKDDLIVIHNMGTGCSSCTMWADGFSGLAPHVMDRAAFVVCSPDKPEVQKRIAQRRNWSFRMVSAYESPFFHDMGFWGNGPWPGVSTFRREPDGSIVRIAKAVFDAGDDFCAVWPLLDLLQDGANGWDPKFSYGEVTQ